MAFMKLTTYTGPYIVVDTGEGTFYVPQADYQADDFESDNVFDVSESSGTLACLDSACYLDCTEWMPVESEATAGREICDMYGCEAEGNLPCYPCDEDDAEYCSICGASYLPEFS